MPTSKGVWKRVPHIIFRGKADLAGVFEHFQSSRRDVNGWILKALQAYLSQNQRILLFECTSVRSGFSQNYYVRAEQKGEAVTIRVDPNTNVEKNEGVKRSLVMVRDMVLPFSPQLVMEKTNLPAEFLADQDQHS